MASGWDDLPRPVGAAEEHRGGRGDRQAGPRGEEHADASRRDLLDVRPGVVEGENLPRGLPGRRACLCAPLRQADAVTEAVTAKCELLDGRRRGGGVGRGPAGGRGGREEGSPEQAAIVGALSAVG